MGASIATVLERAKADALTGLIAVTVVATLCQAQGPKTAMTTGAATSQRRPWDNLVDRASLSGPTSARPSSETATTSPDVSVRAPEPPLCVPRLVPGRLNKGEIGLATPDMGAP